MPTLQSILDNLYYHGKRDYSKRRGNVRYLDGKPLMRANKMSWPQRGFALLLVLAAMGIGYFFIDTTILQGMRETALAEQTTRENLEREASIRSIPHVPDLILLSDEEILETLQSQGNVLYDITSESDVMAITFYRIPPDVSYEDASAMYTRGIDNLSAPQASKILQGMWYCNVDRNGVTTIVVRYADFSTADPQIAVQSAFVNQGFDPESITEEGEDETGNTFRSGTIEIDDVPCKWQISALPLDEIYSINGLTENATYVGVRVTLL